MYRNNRQYNNRRQAPPYRQQQQHQQSYQQQQRARVDPMIEIRRTQRSLPVFKFKSQIVSTVQTNPITLIVGETGSGKTTQIPQYLLEWSQVTTSCKIVCTQPRTVAASSVAQRVSEEQGQSTVGRGVVGYHIRLDRKVSEDTRLEYMTEGILLRKAMSRDNLSEYKVVIVDEAHERTVNADLLMGFLKAMVRERPDDLRVVIMSATLDTERFRKYFADPPIIRVPGSANPVRHHWLSAPTEDYLALTVKTVRAVHSASADATEHILVFLTGQSEIDRVVAELNASCQNLLAVPLYAALRAEDRRRAFAEPPRGVRKCVVATNIAETSLTIDNVVYVIDSGLSKQKSFDAGKGVEELGVRGVSKASVKQRVGRAGRVKPGVAYHLYTQKGYLAMANETPAEILRSGLVDELLAMLALGIANPLKFDFIDAPDEMTMARALHTLRYLEAIEIGQNGLHITEMGSQMASLPVSPRMAKSLITAVRRECVYEVVAVAAMMEIEDRLWRKPPAKEGEHARQRFKEQRKTFTHASGDHLTLLNVFNAYQRVVARRNCNVRDWCSQNYLNHWQLRRADDVRAQIERQLANLQRRQQNADVVVFKQHRLESRGYYERILLSLLSGHFLNIAVKGFGDSFWRFRLIALDAKGAEKAVDILDKAKIHQNSVLAKNGAMNWLFFDEVAEDHCTQLKVVTAVKPKWLFQVRSNGYFDVNALAKDKTPIAQVLRDVAKRQQQQQQQMQAQAQAQLPRAN